MFGELLGSLAKRRKTGDGGAAVEERAVFSASEAALASALRREEAAEKAYEEALSVCEQRKAELGRLTEKANNLRLPVLPLEIWALITDHFDDFNIGICLFAMALTCRAFRNAQVGLLSLPGDRGRLKSQPGVLADAAAAGNLDYVTWLVSEARCPQTTNHSHEPCQAAAREGHLDVIRWLRGRHAPWGKMTSYLAARGGHLEVLKWLREQDPPCPWNPKACRLGATRNKSPHVVAWIDEVEPSVLEPSPRRPVFLPF